MSSKNNQYMKVSVLINACDKEIAHIKSVGENGFSCFSSLFDKKKIKR